MASVTKDHGIKRAFGVMCWTCTFNKLTEERIRRGKANEALTYFESGSEAHQHHEDNPDHIMFVSRSFPNMVAIKKAQEENG